MKLIDNILNLQQIQQKLFQVFSASGTPTLVGIYSLGQRALINAEHYFSFIDTRRNLLAVFIGRTEKGPIAVQIILGTPTDLIEALGELGIEIEQSTPKAA